MKYRALFTLILLIVLVGFVAAQLPPPPPTPNLGENSVPEQQLSQEKPTEPECEIPSASNSLAYTFITLTIMLLIVIATILFLWKKDKNNFMSAHPQSKDQLHTQNNVPITTAQTEYVNSPAEPQTQSSQDEKINAYINQCRAKGYNDDTIRLELLRNGHSADDLNKFFNN